MHAFSILRLSLDSLHGLKLQAILPKCLHLNLTALQMKNQSWVVRLWLHHHTLGGVGRGCGERVLSFQKERKNQRKVGYVFLPQMYLSSAFLGELYIEDAFTFFYSLSVE